MTILFFLHSFWRWVVLIVAVLTALKAVLGWLANQSWGNVDNLLGMLFTTAFDIQFLLGTAVYAGSWLALHPVRWYSSILRLSTEHVLVMIIALVVAHIVRSRAQKATADRARFRISAIGFIISMLLIVAAMPTWTTSTLV